MSRFDARHSLSHEVHTPYTSPSWRTRLPTVPCDFRRRGDKGVGARRFLNTSIEPSTSVGSKLSCPSTQVVPKAARELSCERWRKVVGIARILCFTQKSSVSQKETPCIPSAARGKGSLHLEFMRPEGVETKATLSYHRTRVSQMTRTSREHAVSAEAGNTRMHPRLGGRKREPGYADLRTTTSASPFNPQNA